MTENASLEFLTTFARDAREVFDAGTTAGLEAPFGIFPHDASQATSNLLGLYMEQTLRSKPLVIPGVVSDAGYERVEHFWLRFGNITLDITADTSGLSKVVVTDKLTSVRLSESICVKCRCL